MNTFFDKIEVDVFTLKLLIPHLSEKGVADSCAYHLQQAYEKTLKGYLYAHNIEVKHTYDLTFLYSKASLKYEGLQPYLETLTSWEACTRYDNIPVDISLIRKLYAILAEVYNYYYNACNDSKLRVMHILGECDLNVPVSSILERLPEILPDSDEELTELIKVVVKYM